MERTCCFHRNIPLKSVAELTNQSGGLQKESCRVGQRAFVVQYRRALTTLSAKKMSHQDCHLHPSFKSKPVYELRCVNCDGLVCARGMRAILLGDRNVELYSTDLPPPSTVQLIGKNYETSSCHCRIKDVACTICGTNVGYHVMLPCQSCLASCNNGHFWMFHSHNVRAAERLDSSGMEILVWARVPPCGEDTCMREPEESRWLECCR